MSEEFSFRDKLPRTPRKCSISSIIPKNINDMNKLKIEVVLSSLQEIFPHHSRLNLNKHLGDILRREGRNFSSVPNGDIISQIVETVLSLPPLLKEDKCEKQLKKLPDDCLICCTMLSSKDSTKLGCDHFFHTECLKKWFKEQSTCPCCRKFSLLDDEYPPLS